MSVIACDNVISKAKLSGTPRDTLYPWGKGVCEQKTTDCCLRQSVGQKISYRGPRGILCTRGEKEHTSKRVSIIACDNVISKAKLSGTPRDTVYSRGKGVCEHKTTDCRLRQSVGQKRSYRGPRGILCTRGEKEYASIRQPTAACDNRLVKREAYDVWPWLLYIVRTIYFFHNATIFPA